MFAWDEAKNRINRRKHGIWFHSAIRVFDDPAAVTYQERVVDGEPRWHTLGLVACILVLLVVHTIEAEHGEENIRIISARKATPRERGFYESAK